MAYVRTHDGFVTNVQDVVRAAVRRTRDGNRYSYHVPFFNPSSNWRQRSWLRLINPSNHDAEHWRAG